MPVRRFGSLSPSGHGERSARVPCRVVAPLDGAGMEKVVLTADETALIRYIGQKAAGPRHALRLSADHETVATVTRLQRRGWPKPRGSCSAPVDTRFSACA